MLKTRLGWFATLKQRVEVVCLSSGGGGEPRAEGAKGQFINPMAAPARRQSGDELLHEAAELRLEMLIVRVRMPWKPVEAGGEVMRRQG